MPGYTPLYSFEYPVNADPVWKAAGTIERLARAIESKIAGGAAAAVNADPNTVVRRDANGRAFITDPISAGHIASKAYVDRGNADALTAAKAYHDQNVPPAPDLSGYATTQAMTAADAQTLADAKAYHDQNVPPAPDLSSYATTEAMTAADAQTLASAKAYTDTRVPGGLTVDTSVGTRVFLGSTMIHGEVGKRSLAGLLPAGVTAAAVQLSLDGNLVTLGLVDVVSDVGGNVFLGNILPPGFRPWPRHRFPVLNANYVNIDTAGGVYIYGVQAGTAFSATCVYRTPNSWPATLPGVPT